MGINQIRGVLFDMDGTLIDSEAYTARAVDNVLAELGVHEHDLEPSQFFGITWQSIEALIRNHLPKLPAAPLAPGLQQHFHLLLDREPPPLIPGARSALDEAANHYPTAIVTSSNGQSVETVLDRCGIRDFIDLYVSAEDYERSKPDPECFLLGAKRLGLEPGACLVFEDSVPGLLAAKAAGCAAVAITHRAPDPQQAEAISDLTITDYTELPADFFTSIQ